MFVTKEFQFHSAHFLTKYHGKCERLHGHSYKLVVTVDGPVNENGMVIDFVILKRIVERHVLEKLDHSNLNDVIKNPSAERVVQWIWKKLENLPKLLKGEIGDPNLSIDRLKSVIVPKMLRLYELQLWETESSYVTYRGE